MECKYKYILYVLHILSFIRISQSYFNPFMDKDLCSINWAGPLDLTQSSLIEEKLVSLSTPDNERYRCIIPENTDAEAERIAKLNYAGPTASELMKALHAQTTCSYRLETYWTYELCHGKHLRQYHEEKEGVKKGKRQEYYLGRMKKDETPQMTDGSIPAEKKEAASADAKIRKVEGMELPYFEELMTGGTPCDLTHQPRKVRLLYICQPEGRGEIYEIKETSTCEYDVMVLTSVLCSHPSFKPKDPPVSQIYCHCVDGSPRRPKNLDSWELENRYGTFTTTQEEDPGTKNGILDLVKDTATPPNTNSPYFQVEKTQTGRKVIKPINPQTNLGSQTDKQVLQDFLSGEYCFQGGTGWWKHEFCFGKYVRQFHDGAAGRIVIMLGLWNEKNHLQWLKEHPTKRPKEGVTRVHTSLYYSDGNFCEVTGKKRIVEVRLKCIQNKNQPHAVSLFLMEPKPCEYILGVESPILCKVIEQADENGLISAPLS